MERTSFPSPPFISQLITGLVIFKKKSPHERNKEHNRSMIFLAKNNSRVNFFLYTYFSFENENSNKKL